eukprot:GHRR01009646.1.p1 GENE.GHRR01009646.1~~GHRR01009646.1.p1  ORF type:complete len:278 (+),score=75.28 GHRR01009646.1:84-836(+)
MFGNDTEETAAHGPEPELVQFKLSNGQELEVRCLVSAVAEAAFILNEMFVVDEYFKHGIQLAHGGTVVDIGANIGMFGVRALAAVPGGDISYIGVEPCPPNLQALQLNLLGDGQRGQGGSFFHVNAAYQGPVQPAVEGRQSPAYPGNVKLVNQAVSSRPGTLPITFYPRMPGNSTLREAEKRQLQGLCMPAMFQGCQKFEVPVVTLQQLLEHQGLAGSWGRISSKSIHQHPHGATPSTCAVRVTSRLMTV